MDDRELLGCAVIIIVSLLVIGAITVIVRGSMTVEYDQLRAAYPDLQFRVHWWCGVQVRTNDQWVSAELVTLPVIEQEKR